jgi:hypothetical protein
MASPSSTPPSKKRAIEWDTVKATRRMKKVAPDMWAKVYVEERSFENDPSMPVGNLRLFVSFNHLCLSPGGNVLEALAATLNSKSEYVEASYINKPTYEFVVELLHPSIVSDVLTYMAAVFPLPDNFEMNEDLVKYVENGDPTLFVTVTSSGGGYNIINVFGCFKIVGSHLRGSLGAIINKAHQQWSHDVTPVADDNVTWTLEQIQNLATFKHLRYRVWRLDDDAATFAMTAPAAHHIDPIAVPPHSSTDIACSLTGNPCQTWNETRNESELSKYITCYLTKETSPEAPVSKFVSLHDVQLLNMPELCCCWQAPECECNRCECGCKGNWDHCSENPLNYMGSINVLDDVHSNTDTVCDQIVNFSEHRPIVLTVD